MKKQDKPFKITIKWMGSEPRKQKKSFATEPEAIAFIEGVFDCYHELGDGDFEIVKHWMGTFVTAPLIK